MTTADAVVLGQGLAGTAVAWAMRWRGFRVVVLDREADVTASRVAAGLITPITGQRLAKTWRLGDLWPAAQTFYRRVEEELRDSGSSTPRRRCACSPTPVRPPSTRTGRRRYFPIWSAGRTRRRTPRHSPHHSAASR